MAGFQMSTYGRFWVSTEVLDGDLELWINPTLDRALHAGIAAKLTANQLTAWIAAGR